MTTTIHERSAIQRELEIFVEESELQSAFDDAYKAMRPKLALPGFRPGKAPMGLLKKMHGDAIEGDALEKLAQEKFREAIEENKIEPIGQPVMTDLHRHKGEGAHFKIMYELAPVIELKDTSDVEVEKLNIAVNDDDVGRTMLRMQLRRAVREPISEIKDDQTILKLSFRQVDVPEGEKASESEEEVYLGDPDMLPNLKEALIGRTINEVITLDLPTRRSRRGGNPEDEKLEPAEITIVEAESVKLPEMTEELIKELSGDKATTLEEFREIVRAELVEARDTAAKENLEERIVSKLLEIYDFEVPYSITNAIIGQMMEEAQQENTRHGFPANYGIDQDQFHERNLPMAEARGKWMLLREKLIEDGNIEATDEDLEKLAEEESLKYGVPKEGLLNYYSKYDTVKNRIVNEKVGARLKELVKVVEKTV